MSARRSWKRWRCCSASCTGPTGTRGGSGEQHGYGGGGGGARFFDGGSYVGEGAGMPAPRGAPDPGMVRLDNRWADNIHDPIDMAMLRGGDGDVMHDRNLNGDGNLNGNLDGKLKRALGRARRRRRRRRRRRVRDGRFPAVRRAEHRGGHLDGRGARREARGADRRGADRRDRTDGFEARGMYGVGAGRPRATASPAPSDTTQ